MLKTQLDKYPQMQPSDLLKLLYQHAYGCGHLCADEAYAAQQLRNEAEHMPESAENSAKIEPIGNGYCRVPLSLLQHTTLSIDTLNRMFMQSAIEQGAPQILVDLVEDVQQSGVPYDWQAVRKALQRWLEEGAQTFSHSAVYHEAYQPHYRVIKQVFADFLPLFAHLDAKLQNTPIVLAIDGRCAAGKTTLAGLLQQIYGCPVVHMDEFFLQMHQRTPERLAEAGGNVDRERFMEEVLNPLKQGKKFAYRPYLCQFGHLGDAIDVSPAPLVVVEGAYCLHPALRSGYTCAVMCSVAPAEQLRRIEVRNGSVMRKRFENEWIPLEEAYLAAFDLPSVCDFLFTT